MDKAAVVPLPITGGVNDDRTAALQQWASTVGFGGEVGLLVEAHRRLDSVLAETQGKEIRNKELQRRLREASHDAARARDLLGELEYYRIREEVERDDHDKLLHDNANGNLLLSMPQRDVEFFNNDAAKDDKDTTESSLSNTDSSASALQVTTYIASSSSPVPCLETLNKCISNEISKYTEKCYRIAKQVSEALELESLDYLYAHKYQRTRTDHRETSPCQSEPKVHGRDQQRDLIISKLTSEECARKKLSILAIIGDGGIGKTTLAKLVFNNSTVSKHFDVLLWVYVSVHFDQNKIMQEMLDSFCGDEHDEIKKSKELQLQDKLDYLLKSKRVLLVMDDMWEDSTKEKWDELLNPLLKNDVMGNSVLVTTRKPSVATMIEAADHINLDGLKKDDFWCLFKECVFGHENYKGEPRLEKIGQQIVDKLKGNPLAAKTVSKVLRRSFDVDYWRRILHTSEWKYKNDENDIMPALMISYKYLPAHLQSCFSYCAVFPKYHRYEKERLINMWIAQDLLCSADIHTRPEDIGNEYFDDLLDWGFFEKQFEHSTLLIMHDLIHDLAQKVSSDESFTIEGNEPRNAPPCVRHVSVITEWEYKTKLNGTVYPNDSFLQEFSNSFRELQQRSLSTLMLFGPHDLDFADTFRQELNEVRSIRVLKLEMVFFDLDSLIGNISAFVNLRYLELGCFYKGPRLELPEAICRLYHLKVLDIKKNWGPSTSLPREMSKLVNLRHFIAEKELHAKIAGIGKMVSLQELKAFDVKKDHEFSISQLRGLNQLRGSISISSLYNAGHEEASQARLCDKDNLTCLHLSWLTLSRNRVARRTLPILEDLKPHSGLRNLQVVGYRHSLPSWLCSTVHLTSLRSLHLDRCIRWQTIPHPQQLPLLQELHLIQLPRVYKIEIGPLKVLEIRWLQNLRQCILLDKEQSYATLQILEVEGCPKLDEFVLQIFMSSGVQSTYQFLGIHRLKIHNDFLRASIPLLLLNSLSDIDLCGEHSKFTRFRLKPFGTSDGLSLQIKGDRYIQKIEERLFTLEKLKDLRELEIRDYQSVIFQRQFWEGFEQLTSLKKFRVIKCPEIFSTNFELFLPPSVEELELSGCNITLIQLSQLLVNLHLLKSFKLTNCQGVTSLPVGLFTDEQNTMSEGSWHIPPRCFTSLESLQISFTTAPSDANSIMHFTSKKGLGRFVSLKKIVIENCPTLLSRALSGGASHISPSSLDKLCMTGIQDSTLQFSDVSSIADLDVSGCPKLACLDLSSCTALEKLCVIDCRLLQSIEGLPSCSALRDLKIRNCALLPSLSASLHTLKTLSIENNTNLASLELKSCTSLQKLCIKDCPALTSWEGLKSLVSLEILKVEASPGFITRWISAAAEVNIEEKNFSLPLEKLNVDNIDVLCVPICSQLTSLKILSIEEDRHDPDGHVEFLTDNHVKGLSFLTCLRFLDLENFEQLRSLPAELGSLASLQRLHVGNCGHITSLPVGGLPASLKDMELYNCSKELNVLCRDMLRLRRNLHLWVDGDEEDFFSQNCSDEEIS
uniref:Uncharacterized protein n=1 Tax=Oryza nivara TaxID=4536 RepID=A0A0E0I9Y0_ORYNI